MGINVNVTYNKEMIAAAAQAERAKMTEGFFPAIVTAAEVATSKEKTDEQGNTKGNNLMVVAELHVLKDPDDPTTTTGPRLRTWMVCPFSNPDVPGHEPHPATGRMMARSLNAFFPEDIKAMPEMRKGKIVFDGEEISEAEKEKADNEILEAVFEKAKELLQDPSSLLRRQCIIKVGYDKTNPDFPTIKGLFAELPDGASLVAPENYTTKPAPKSIATKAKGKAKRG